MLFVTGVTTSDRYPPWERILFLAGTGADDESWYLSQEDVIAAIRTGFMDRFYVEHQGHLVKLVVAVSPQGRDYVKAEIDEDAPDTLLRLPECPAPPR